MQCEDFPRNVFWMLFYLLLVVPGSVLAVPDIHTLHEGKFKVDFACENEDSVCDGFKETVKHVSKLFENALNLKKEIYAQIAVGSFSGENVADTILGSTELEYDPIEKARGRLVPKALCKQIGTCSNDDQADFTVFINKDQPFYFASDFGEKEVGSSAIDTLAHEFLHGMGFSDCIISGFCNANVVPFFKKSAGHYENTATIKFFSSSFVDHIPLGDATSDKAQLTDYHLDIAKQIEDKVTKRGKLYFKTLKGNEVLLDTKGEFTPGKSISHLDLGYKLTREELMIKNTGFGKGIHNMEFDRWLTSPFGPLTLEILETIGYQLNPKPLYDKSLLGLKKQIKNSS
ncbi:hypothetical protein DSO57_1020337 [Entomophthora muscae]|uniref:Uncharacterized protein n=1 Tax=Entomophthora muscae TaxID=34485 RepID=A0ACC2T3R8_9FUNG|nr:hypothetical protein DSO57_1020337 [Entomophthora muscae]